MSNVTKHLSIKVPWHDNQWNGTVCKNPNENLSCKIIKDIKKENDNSGKKIADINKNEDIPPCTNENGFFMSNYDFFTFANHPYSNYGWQYKKHFSHFKETKMLNKAYSATVIPFKWLKRKTVEDKSNSVNYLINNYNKIKEEEILKNLKKDINNANLDFIFDIDNQRAALNYFFGNIKPNKSICFFYSDEIPGLENNSKSLVGIGLVENVSEEKEYVTNDTMGNKLRSLIWERNIQHSIRNNYKNGFLYPIKEILIYLEKHSEYNIEDFVVTIPNEKREEFSYKSELVSNDTSIIIIRKCIDYLYKIRDKISTQCFDFDYQISWLNELLIEIDKIRGNYPGLGAVLTEFGFDEGFLIAEDLNKLTNNDEDVWHTIEKFVEQPINFLSEERAKNVDKIKTKISTLKDLIYKKNTKLKLMQLLSRFDISIEQIKYITNNLNDIIKRMRIEDLKNRNYNCRIEDIIDNPYLLYDLTTNEKNKIDFDVIDAGLFSINNKHDLFPIESNMKDKLDSRRVNSLITKILEEEANQNGNSLILLETLVKKIEEMPLITDCRINTHDVIAIIDKLNKIELIEIEKDKYACQMKKYAIIKEYIKNKVNKRIEAKKLDNIIDWKTQIIQFFKGKNILLDEEELFEKEAALKILTESRFSILTGKAGTGKTTIIKLFCENDRINKDGILLLAPTGKAKIRLSSDLASKQIKSFTIAQFLYHHKRFDSENMRYHFNNDDKQETRFKTVIIDEASMLTEEMLSSVFQSLSDVDRYILVGDYRQLPPIGLGKPFVDIVNFLKSKDDIIDKKFLKTTNSYAELTINNRQKYNNIIREDIELADYFTGNNYKDKFNSIFDKITSKKDLINLRLISFKNEKEFEDKFTSVLIEELKLDNKNDKEGFNKTLGSFDGSCFLNSNHKKKPTKINKISDWQIITPVKQKKYGVKNINRIIQNNFKDINNKFANTHLFYEDKVINVKNKKKKYFFNKYEGFVANGEIGIVLTKKEGKKIKVEFDSQKNKIFEYNFNEIERENNLEPAYAITTHKSQGSDFKTTFVVLPDPCLLLSRELIYTALTRHKERIVIFYQGEDIFSLKKYSTDLNSELAKRMTNLFRVPVIKNIEGKYYDSNLIHCASDNTILRSKSELIIYERLLLKGLNPIYEENIVLSNKTIKPDFTIKDEDTGKTYYWEHCGMLEDDIYASKWSKKKKLYEENGIKLLEDGGGEKGTLIVTSDSKDKGISVPIIDKIIESIV